MAVNDIVAPRLTQSSPSTFEGAPSWGHVVAEAAGPPLTKTILWADTGLLSTIDAASEADFTLDVIEDASQQTVNTFAGRVALAIAPSGATSRDPAGGTSAAYAGLVVSVHRRTPSNAAPGSGAEQVLIQAAPNEYLEDLATAFAVLGNR